MSITCVILQDHLNLVFDIFRYKNILKQHPVVSPVLHPTALSFINLTVILIVLDSY